MDSDSSLESEIENLISVGNFDSLAEAEEYSLVAMAMGMTCWIIEPQSNPQRPEILADRLHADAISHEFAAYASEQAEPDITPSDSPTFRGGVELACLWVFALMVTFHFQGQDPGMTERFTNSSLGLIDQGQWWRPFTALFLHADVGHLLGNIVLGVTLFLLVTSSVGPWLGGALILTSGTIGNALSAVIHHPANFRSLGASTAVFGALGILVGLEVIRAWRSRTYNKVGGAMIPLGAGIILLGWLGSGDPPSDVLSHCLGFLVGGVLGWTRGQFRN